MKPPPTDPREVLEEAAKVAEFEHSVGTNGIGIAAAIRHLATHPKWRTSSGPPPGEASPSEAKLLLDAAEYIECMAGDLLGDVPEPAASQAAACRRAAVPGEASPSEDELDSFAAWAREHYGADVPWMLAKYRALSRRRATPTGGQAE